VTADSVDPTTEELRVAQTKRERALRDAVDRAPEDEDTGQFEARANKAAYLREKLDERARSERQADREEE
jgi:hypothetical protein